MLFTVKVYEYVMKRLHTNHCKEIDHPERIVNLYIYFSNDFTKSVEFTHTLLVTNSIVLLQKVDRT